MDDTSKRLYNIHLLQSEEDWYVEVSYFCNPNDPLEEECICHNWVKDADTAFNLAKEYIKSIGGHI